MKHISKSALMNQKNTSSDSLINEYLANGGKITKCKPYYNGGSQQIRCKNKTDRHSKNYQHLSRLSRD